MWPCLRDAVLHAVGRESNVEDEESVKTGSKRSDFESDNRKGGKEQDGNVYSETKRLFDTSAAALANKLFGLH